MLVETTPVEDERGFFARYFCAEEFAAHGIDPAVAQCSISFNKSAFTLRGMHFQTAPHAEQKFIRCTAGAIFDVVVDIRRGSPSFGKWFGAELTAANRRALLAPRGTAHGFLTLQENCEVFYMISTPFAAGAGAGLRWDDPAIGIRWPAPPAVISPRDAAWPAFGDCVS
jgi:dTDP-4-dehydrorhamnose 3,5-epimerase